MKNVRIIFFVNIIFLKLSAGFCNEQARKNNEKNSSQLAPFHVLASELDSTTKVLPEARVSYNRLILNPEGRRAFEYRFLFALFNEEERQSKGRAPFYVAREEE